ncbi:Pls/PosA family non-ribosomal peptide synthetase [Amycolatopsis sp. PS_44_ISF1]|uniref:Pls/PosA family non-ribosomal peptide synthetase n=1 Tax=Amycolatopsis sp. PS_44_ISF1 TaxID=2974917 RepID=UPI0028DDAD72|nr:Pls/PosA family non-ribosomal peptide synthetase [Amycolatopsis sp. PS_44_ISF1]MDT8913839.1 amino acid adenylation domain-containing protein [Amycolatopsis sp. PS_44_ISF1]
MSVLGESVSRYPEAPALDDGEQLLSYTELDREVRRRAAVLREAGVRAGDRVGVRVPSGTAELYVAILAVLAAGAAYVPVDADDPDERAELVWREARVYAVIGAGEELVVRPGKQPGGSGAEPAPEDDAWIIFTSGSTGRPKGVAVTHRAAAAFVDAEARLFLPSAPIGPGDRVLAGLSVAFDASCEEMWLAWRSGACLVPAPRALVRTGTDLGPWLRRRGITVVSTVPTLAAMWPVDDLAAVRLVVLGGEACPPEVVRRFDDGVREVWNTYGPTEATVVSCAARLRAGEPVGIGLPLEGWRLAVVDAAGRPVRWGETGELVIGGAGLGRYLDAVKDAEKFVPLPALGWDRGYRSGDLVRAQPDGLVFLGRADDQVKLGGRRIELGEVEAALQELPSIAAAAAAVRRTAGGIDVLVGYVVPAGAGFDPAGATRLLRDRLPAALVPRLAVLADLPTRSSGKVDRDALPWPLPRSRDAAVRTGLDPGTDRLVTVWGELLGVEAGPDDDFFDLGGTSLAAARLVSVLREHHPGVSVADLYRHPTPARLASVLGPVARPRPQRVFDRTPRYSGWVQGAIQLVLLGVTGVRWLLMIALIGNLLPLLVQESWLPEMSWWVLAPSWLVLFSPAGRMLVSAFGARALRGRIRPGEYRRGGRTHLRLWAAERFAASFGPSTITGTPLAARYARLLGCTVGSGTDLHAPPPVTGLASFGDGCAVEPEADLAGWWLDGDVLHVGEVRVGERARVGARSTLLPGAVVGADAVLLPGSCLGGVVADGATWGGSPAAPHQRAADDRWPASRPARSLGWAALYLAGGALRGLLLGAAAVPPAVLAVLVLPSGATLGTAVAALLAWVPLMVLAGLLGYALLVLALTRLAGAAVEPGTHPVHSRAGWAAWLVHDLMDLARKSLFPFYASLFTPVWLRWLGARVGRSVEASTVLALPGMLRVEDSAFLADDVLAAPYELRGGWVRIGPAEVGARAFVGNSGIVGPGRRVGRGALIGVLSDTPETVPDGSSWLGRPPMRLRREAETPDPARTFAPRKALRVARALVELGRITPLVVAGLLGTATFAAFAALYRSFGFWPAAGAGGFVLVLAGGLAGLVTTAAKWLLIGRFRAGRHPLWSSFVWRNELFDTFVEMLAVPWLTQPFSGTPVLNWWLRSLGARIGRGVWCESHWLPEPDLVTIGAGTSVNRGCVLQTHLFHDRVMRLEPVTLDADATLGPRTIVLPGSRVGPAATIGAGSLVMAAESVPGHSRWQGAPIAAQVT